MSPVPAQYFLIRFSFVDICHAFFSSNFINITGTILNHMKRMFIHTFHLYIMLYPVNPNEKRVTVILWHTYM